MRDIVKKRSKKRIGEEIEITALKEKEKDT